MKFRKGLWSPDEDEKLTKCISQYRNGSWSDIARKAGLERCGKSCRRRWMNHLRPHLKRGPFSQDEIKLVVKLHRSLGNKWSEIAARLVGRTDNDVKNLWNTQIKRQLNRFRNHNVKQQMRPTDMSAKQLDNHDDDDNNDDNDDDYDYHASPDVEVKAASICITGLSSAPAAHDIDGNTLSNSTIVASSIPFDTTHAADSLDISIQTSPLVNSIPAKQQLRTTASLNIHKPAWFTFPFDGIASTRYTDPGSTRGLFTQQEVPVAVHDYGASVNKYSSYPSISMCGVANNNNRQLPVDINDQIIMQLCEPTTAPLMCPHQLLFTTPAQCSADVYPRINIKPHNYRSNIPTAGSSSNLPILGASAGGHDSNDQKILRSVSTQEISGPHLFERGVAEGHCSHVFHGDRHIETCSNVSDPHSPTILCSNWVDSDESAPAGSATIGTASAANKLSGSQLLQVFSRPVVVAPSAAAPTQAGGYTEATQALTSNFPESESSDDEDWLLHIFLNHEVKNFNSSAMMSSYTGDIGQLADFPNREDSSCTINWWSSFGSPDSTS